ncbi:MAG: hypothetical protein VX104_04325, partial [Planctomycetota bacterium]|nr:hypothetical protein [Planctomycetota bacterium]
LPNLGFDHDKIATAGIGRLLRRVLEDPLTRRIIPPPLLRARIDDLARGGAVARHFQRRMQRIMEEAMEPPQSIAYRFLPEPTEDSNFAPKVESVASPLEDPIDSKERLGRLYELMAADSKPAERPHPLAMLLPKTFTLPELRQFFEFMLDESIDRGNFRRRISELISFGALTDLGETRSEGRGRPAELYRLDSNRLRRFLDTEEKK